MKRMKKSYISPEFELVQFKFTDVVSNLAPSQTPETPVNDNEYDLEGYGEDSEHN